MLEGSIVALITPFKENGDVNYQKIGDLLNFHLHNCTPNILLLGTTGESATLSKAEKENIIRFVVKKIKNKINIVIGVCSNCTKEAIENAKRYESLGADYLLVITPFYNKCNQNGLLLHFQMIADCVNIPLILYNIPSRTGVNISIETLSKMKNNPKIIGIKEANTDFNHLVSVAKICDDSFGLYCGNDNYLFLFILLNCRGMFNVYGNIDPKVMNDIWSNRHNQTMNSTEFFRLIDVFNSLTLDINPIPIKSLMNHQGFKVGWFRLPLTEMNSPNYLDLINAYNKVKNHSIIL